MGDPRLLALLLLLTTPCEAGPLVGTRSFINQAGSTMQFTPGPDGAITGTYVSAVGCGVGVPRKLVGWINGSAVTFSVSFGECGSATSWVGHIDETGAISSIWTLARGADSGWNAKLTGTSVFTPREN